MGDKQKPWLNASLSSDFYLISEEARLKLANDRAQKVEVQRQAELSKAAEAARLSESLKTDQARLEAEQARAATEAALKAKMEAEAAVAAISALAREEAARAEAARIAAEQARKASEAALQAAQNLPRGKLRIESGIRGKVYLGFEVLGDVGPGAPLIADSLDPGQVNIRFIGEDGSKESYMATVTDKAYSTIAFRQDSIAKSGLGPANGSITLPWVQEGFKVRLDGQVIAGTTTSTSSTAVGLSIPDLGPREYNLVVDIPGYGLYSSTVSVTSGETKVVRKPYGFMIDQHTLALDPLYVKQIKAEGARAFANFFWRNSLIGLGVGALGFVYGVSYMGAYEAADTREAALTIGGNIFLANVMVGTGVGFATLNAIPALITNLFNRSPTYYSKMIEPIEQKIKSLAAEDLAP